MGQALYRKYRSKSFDEVVGQEHITDTLKKALKSGKISHAYLFTGPRGVGKTSVARILAHEVNELPYTDESLHLDIIEIDAASNRRIDEIRDLREKVHAAPTSAKYKVYIIDEVHMLTREAFNALLKTLEEPPAHCIFILATTEAHKLPETITSRTQRFNFRAVDDKSSTEHLKTIAKKEDIKITEPALRLLAEHGEGSFRDSIGLLDQLRNTASSVDEKTVREFLGLPPAEMIEELVYHLKRSGTPEVLRTLNELHEHGANPVKIALHLGRQLRSELISGRSDPWIPELMRELLDVPASHSPREYLEICLLEAAGKITPDHEEDAKNDTSASDKHESKSPAQQVAPQQTSTKEPVPKKNPTTLSSADFNSQYWPQVLENVRDQAASIYTALRLAVPNLSQDELVLSFQFPLHQSKVRQPKNIQVLGRVLDEVTGTKLRIRCEVDKNAVQPRLSNQRNATLLEQAGRDDSLTAINNIFGNAEVLES